MSKKRKEKKRRKKRNEERPHLSNIRIQDAEQVRLPLSLPALKSLSQLGHHPARIPFAPVLRRTKDTSNAVRHDILNLTIRGDKRSLQNRLAAAQDFPVFLASAVGLVHQDPRREPAVSGQSLLQQVFLAAEVGRDGQYAAPFFAVDVQLGELFFGCG